MSNFFDEQIITAQDSDTSVSDQPLDNEESTSDTSEEQYTPQNIKNATQELMKYGLLEMERKPKLYQTALTHQPTINNILAPLDLRLKIDDIRGLAFLVVAEEIFSGEAEGDWSHPLIRHRRLTLEQTLLIAILRQNYVAHEQEAGVGAGGALIDIDDLRPQLFTYLGESGSDARDQARLIKLLEQLYSLGIVSEINEKAQVTIRPIITHVANPETLQLLLQHLRQITQVNVTENE
jgi:hypothetical protein